MPKTTLAEANQHPPDRKRVGIAAYLAAGSFRAAERETGIPERTIAYWVQQSDTELFNQIQDELTPGIRRAQIAAFQGIVTRSAETADKALSKLDTALDQENAKDANSYASAYRNVMTGAGISNQNSQLLQGLPTDITATLSTDEALRSMARMVGVTLEGTATEDTQDVALLTQTCDPNARES